METTRSVSTHRRARQEASEIASSLQHVPAIQSRLATLAQLASQSRHALESLKAHDAGPLAQLEAAQALTFDQRAEMAEIFAALKETHSALIQSQRASIETPDTPRRSQEIDAALATAQNTAEARQSSITRKKNEIEDLEAKLATVVGKLDRQIDFAPVEAMQARITQHERALAASRRIEDDIENDHKIGREKLIRAKLDLIRQELALNDQLNAAEHSEAINAARETIGALATPAALSLAMERHVGLSPDALASRLRSGRFIASQGHEVSTAPVELASSYYSLHALHLAIIDAIEKAPPNAAHSGRDSVEVIIGHDSALGLTACLTNDEVSARNSHCSMVRYAQGRDGALRVAHIYPA